MRVKIRPPVTAQTVMRQFWRLGRNQPVPHTLENLAQIMGAPQDEVRSVLRVLSSGGFVLSSRPAYHEARIWDATAKGAAAARKLAEAGE